VIAADATALLAMTANPYQFADGSDRPAMAFAFAELFPKLAAQIATAFNRKTRIDGCMGHDCRAEISGGLLKEQFGAEGQQPSSTYPNLRGFQALLPKLFYCARQACPNSVLLKRDLNIGQS